MHVSGFRYAWRLGETITEPQSQDTNTTWALVPPEPALACRSRAEYWDLRSPKTPPGNLGEPFWSQEQSGVTLLLGGTTELSDYPSPSLLRATGQGWAGGVGFGLECRNQGGDAKCEAEEGQVPSPGEKPHV